MWARLNDNNEIAQLYTRPIAVTLNAVQYPASIFSIWTASELQALNIWAVTMSNSPENSVWYDVSMPAYAVTKDGSDNVTGVTGTYTNNVKPIEDIYRIPVDAANGFSVGNMIGSNSSIASSAKVGKIVGKGTGYADEKYFDYLSVEVTKGTFADGNTVRGFIDDGTAALSPAVSTVVEGTLSLESRSKKWDVIQVIKSNQKSKLEPYDWYYIRKTDAGTAVPSAVQTYRDGVRTKATEFETAIAATTTSAELQALDFSSWPSEPEV